MSDRIVKVRREPRQLPRADMTAIHERREQFVRTGLEVQGSANCHWGEDGKLKSVIYTVADCGPFNHT